MILKLLGVLFTSLCSLNFNSLDHNEVKEEKPYQKAIIDANDDITITFNYLMSYQAFNMYYDYVTTQWPNDFGSDRTTTNSFHYKNAYSYHNLVSQWGNPDSALYGHDLFSVAFRQFANINFLGQSCQLYRLYFYTSFNPTNSTTALFRFTWYKINPYTEVEGVHNYLIYGFAQYYDNGWTNYPNLGSYTDNYLYCTQTTPSEGYDLNLANLFRPFDYDNTDITTAYDNGYNNGYTEGYDDGSLEGYNNGHDIGYTEGYDSGYSSGSNIGYTQGYDDGVTFGKSTGYDLGYNTGFQTGSAEGYQTGYGIGYSDAENLDSNALTIFTGILQVGLLPVNVFLAFFQYEVFGINIAGFVGGLLTIAITIIIIRIILGGNKND